MPPSSSNVVSTPAPVSSPVQSSSTSTSQATWSECYTSITQILHLPTPTPIDNCVQNSQADQHNDDVVGLIAPFQLRLYGTTSSKVSVSSNGLLSLAQDQTPAFASNYLPSSIVAPLTAAVFWYDLAVQDIDQGIWYYANSTTLMIEFRLSDPASTDPPWLYYQYMAVYRTSAPGVIQFYYYDIENSNGGVGAEIGIQASQTGK